MFANNVTSTFNVLWAAAERGIRRVVIASSINVSGLPYNSHPVLPAYFPFDEQLPADIDDAYALSKIVDEQTARMAYARAGATSTPEMPPGSSSSASAARSRSLLGFRAEHPLSLPTQRLPDQP